MEDHKSQCLLCGAPIRYYEQVVPVRCEKCGKEETSLCTCENGHYVCDECHAQGALTVIAAVCGKETSKNLIEIADRLMQNPAIHMHGPEHHVLVGAALLTAYRNSGGQIDLMQALREMEARGKNVPGGVCGFWGTCGSAISAGICMSILTHATPLSGESWGLCNRMTSTVLDRLGTVGGPRCCKRNGFLSMLTAAEFIKTHLGVEMELPEQVICTYSKYNNECLGTRCPFHVSKAE